MEGNDDNPTYNQHIFPLAHPNPMPCFATDNQVYDCTQILPPQHNNINTSILLDAGIGIGIGMGMSMATPNTYHQHSLPSSPIQPQTPFTPNYPSFEITQHHHHTHNPMVNWPPIDPLMLPQNLPRFIHPFDPYPQTLGRSSSLPQLNPNNHYALYTRRVHSNPLPLTLNEYHVESTMDSGPLNQSEPAVAVSTINPALIAQTNAWNAGLAREGVLYVSDGFGDATGEGRKIWGDEVDEEEGEEGEEEGGGGISRFGGDGDVGDDMGLGLGLGFDNGWGNGGVVGMGLSGSWGGAASGESSFEGIEHGIEIVEPKRSEDGGSSPGMAGETEEELANTPRPSENYESVKIPTSTSTSTFTAQPDPHTLEVTITPTKTKTYVPDPLAISTSCIRDTRSINSSTQSKSDKSEISPSAFATGKYNEDYDPDDAPGKSLRSRSSRVNPKSKYNLDNDTCSPSLPKTRSTSLKTRKNRSRIENEDVENEELKEITNEEMFWVDSPLSGIEPGEGVLTHDILDVKRLRRGFQLYHHEKILVLLADGRFEKYIHWSENGEDIIIPNEDAFVKNVAGKFWKTDIWDSFTRSCAMSGISHREEGASYHALSHPRLRQTDPYLWNLVRRLPPFDLSKTLIDQPKPKSATKLLNENTRLRRLLQEHMKWTEEDVNRELSSGMSALCVKSDSKSRQSSLKVKSESLDSTSSSSTPTPDSSKSEDTTPTKAYPTSKKGAKVPPYHSPAYVMFTTPGCDVVEQTEDVIPDVKVVKAGLRKRKSVRDLGVGSAGESEGEEDGDECSQEKGKNVKGKRGAKEVLVGGKVVRKGLKHKRSKTG